MPYVAPLAEMRFVIDTLAPLEAEAAEDGGDSGDSGDSGGE